MTSDCTCVDTSVAEQSSIALSSLVQYDVSDFAFGMGLIDGGQRRALKKQEEKCIKSLKANNYA